MSGSPGERAGTRRHQRTDSRRTSIAAGRDRFAFCFDGAEICRVSA